MDNYQRWSLVFAGITASGVICSLVISFFKFWQSRTKKVLATISSLKIHKTKDIIYISTNLNIINQTSLPTSILSIELYFGKTSVRGKHIARVIQNLLTTIDTQNISLYPFESIALNETKFECPTEFFCEKAILKVNTTQRSYCCPILCREHEER